MESDKTYYFCSEQECDVVYFNKEQQVFIKNDLKVPVFQKDIEEDVPICYCFNIFPKGVPIYKRVTGSEVHPNC
ncbi:hypothetical protein AB1283_05870 [Bacillus sp. S13(2024)]|uniref:hypothetical protein n=1 Tax=unclassified Bacillus (in: firmicutes) TaxID=185979 RepID=UPI003D248179